MSKEQNCFEIQGTAVKSLGWMIDKLNKCNISDIENIFCKIATFLMKCVEIESSFTDNKYTISELEFYYCRDDHEDCYCHSYESYKKGYDHKQKQRLCWYFHGSGMDITIGDGKNIYGGILIRSVLENKELLISGPLNARAKIFNLKNTTDKENEKNKVDNCNNLIKHPNVSEKCNIELNLINIENKDVVSDCDEIGKYLDNSKICIVKKFPRYGLNPIKENFEYLCNDIKPFYCRPYRFILNAK